jgi:hypothetical protein
VRAEQEVVVSAVRDLEHAGVVADDDCPPVRAFGDVLDAGDCPCGEVGGHRFPVQWAHERKAQQQASVGDQAVCLPAPCAKLARRLAEYLAARAVELPQAPEACGVGDLGDREVGVVEQPAGEMCAGRARQPVRGHSHMCLEQASKVPRRDTEPGPEIGFSPLIQSPVEDQADCAADERWRGPAEGLRPAVRAAPMACPVAGGLGGGGERERSHVPCAGPRRAPGTAVDARGDDRREARHDVRYTVFASAKPDGFGHGVLQQPLPLRPRTA